MEKTETPGAKEEKKEEKIQELDKLQEETKKEILKDEKRVAESELIARIYTDLGGSEKISLRAFTKKLEDVHKVKCSHTKVRNILIDQGVYKPVAGQPGPPGKEEEKPGLDFEGGTKLLYDFFFNTILSGEEEEPPEELLKNPRLIFRMGEKELDELGEITDKILEKYDPLYNKWKLEFNFGAMFITSILTRFITFKKVIKWKKQKSLPSSEKQEPEKPTI